MLGKDCRILRAKLLTECMEVWQAARCSNICEEHASLCTWYTSYSTLELLLALAIDDVSHRASAQLRYGRLRQTWPCLWPSLPYPPQSADIKALSLRSWQILLRNNSARLLTRTLAAPWTFLAGTSLSESTRLPDFFCCIHQQCGNVDPLARLLGALAGPTVKACTGTLGSVP